MKYFKPCSEGGMMSGIIIVDEAIDSITFHGLITIAWTWMCCWATWLAWVAFPLTRSDEPQWWLLATHRAGLLGESCWMAPVVEASMLRVGGAVVGLFLAIMS